ncbi:MAG: OadG family protein [Clostridiales bacterium]|nr:OadG family protein [Clostridiales bacterium]
MSMFQIILESSTNLLSTKDKLSWGVNGLLIGLGSVFVILVLLILVINLLKLASNGKTVENKPVSKIALKKDHVDENEDEIVAVIMAAINSLNTQRTGKKFAIKSYRRINTKTRNSY